jgi:hypothetical protein
MKTLAVAFLFASGMLMAQETAAPEPQPVSHHVGYFDRIALRTQDPPVKVHSRKHANKPTKYMVTENKSTIVAVPRASLQNQQ